MQRLAPKTSPVLRMGRLKGAPPNEVLYRNQSIYTQYFQLRYYPQARAQDPVALAALAQRGRDGRSVGIYNLDDRLVLSFIQSIAQTSKSAVIRRRLKLRLKAAFRITLSQAGVEAFPPKPMHLLLTPKMDIMNAPFEELKEVAINTYWRARKRFEALPERQQAAMAPRMPNSEGNGRNQGKTRTSHTASSEMISLPNVPSTAYLQSHGGPAQLLRRMQALADTNSLRNINENAR